MSDTDFASNDAALAEATAYKIKDEDIDRARSLIGINRPNKAHRTYTTASYDSIRAFTRAIGDDNPLYTNETYGEKTRWGGTIAPGPFLKAINTPLLGDDLSDELKAKTRSLFKGVHQFMSGGEYEFYRPVKPGDRIYSFVGIESVEPMPSAFAGRSVFVRHREVNMDQNGEIVAVRRWLMIHVERKASREKGKYAATEPASYTDEEIAKLDEIYRAEKRRGASPRYWEDVEVGDSLGPIAKGPLTLTEIIVFHGSGSMTYPFLSASRLWHKNRQQFPAFYIKNLQGIPEVGQRVHWDSDWAKAIGNPMAYDYGFTRTCWLHHLLTDWAGDDGFVVHQQEDIRKFNYMGDYHILTGKVTGKSDVDGVHTVEVSTEAVNQRQEVTAMGVAKIRLPSRAHGAVQLPTVDPELQKAATRMIERHRELSAQQDGE